jgi:hypothetical protein
MTFLIELLPSWFYTGFVAQVLLFAILWVVFSLVQRVKKYIRFLRKVSGRNRRHRSKHIGPYAEVLFD